jgi:exonuclease VII small subunit
MKNENIPADIKSKSLKEARAEIDIILSKLENQETNLDESISDYHRLILLNKHIDEMFKKKFKEISEKVKNDY